MTDLKKLTKLNTVFTKDDIIFSIGGYFEGLAPNSLGYDFEDTTNDYFALAMGLAVTTKKRIYIICTEDYLLRYLTTLQQIAVNKTSNLYIIVCILGYYFPNKDLPTIINNIRSIKGVLFNIGVLVHDYTEYLKSKASLTQLKKVIKSTIGPTVSLIYLNK